MQSAKPSHGVGMALIRAVVVTRAPRGIGELADAEAGGGHGGEGDRGEAEAGTDRFWVLDALSMHT